MSDSDLYTTNQQLRKQLRAFFSQARANELKMRRFQEQELRLISLNSLPELLHTLLHDYRAAFELDVVTLSLIDPAFELQHILTDEGMDLDAHTGLMFCETADELDAFYGFSGAPVLDKYHPERHGALFARCEAKPASIALVPLLRYGEMIGSLNLGSFREERFVTGSGTDFLQRLAAVAAICLENAANHERLKRVGLTDFLTAVNNRRFFEQRLGEELTRAKRRNEPLSCLLLDIDHFKRINDTYGHRAGDQVLKAFADLVRRQLRCSDILARYGGEEFVVLLVDSPADVAVEIAERIRNELAGHAITVDNGQVIRATVSVGVALIQCAHDPRPSQEIGAMLVEQADQALYQAKNEGRNRVVCAGYCSVNPAGAPDNS
ncbi:MAG: DUF484 family protein [Pseudomonadota bacterium]